MSLEVDVHGAQSNILRELLFVRHASFAELQRPTGLTSDHFNFHISRLVELQLVEKVSRGRYQLTTRGKEYANKLDTDQRTIERQPKVAVLLAPERTTEGVTEYLFQERLKNPYFGYSGFISGKMRWGESIEETAARELHEEAGLTANVEIKGLYHEHTYLKETGEMLEDKLFFVVRCFDVQGELTAQFEGGHNAWMSEAQANSLAKKFSSFTTEMAMIHQPSGTFTHEIHQYSREEF
jgi:ADP-ribose pyrophosphatase YjhB (NUDIX family)